MKAKRERYTPHDVGPSPLEWDAPYLKDVSSLITNGFVGTATPYYTDEKGVPYLYGTNVRANKIDSKGIRYINQDFHAKQEKTKLQKGDLLTVQSGHIGETAVVPDEFDGANCHALIVTRTKNKYVFPDFLSYYINSEIGKARLKGLEVGSTILHINTKDLKKFRVLLPPLQEQRKIAKILSTWDKAISTTERLIDNSKQQKKALMQQLLTGKKRLLDDSGKPFEGEWTHGYLGDLCVFKGGSAFKEVYQGNSTGEIPFIKVSDMNLPRNGKFICEANNWVTKDIAKEMKAKGFPKGAVVFAKVGAALLLNRRRILTRETIIDNNMMAATPLASVTTEFLYQIMLAIDFAKFVQDGAVPSVNQSDLNKFKLTYPKRIEQQKIASVLANADQEIELLEQQLADLKQEKKALMQQLLTGKRRVKVDDKEVV